MSDSEADTEAESCDTQATELDVPPPAPSSAVRAPAAPGPAAARPAPAAARAVLRRRPASPARVRTWPWRAGEEADLLQIVRKGTLSAAARESPSRTRASLTFWGRTAAILGRQFPPVRETAVVWARWAELDPGAAAAESEEEEDEGDEEEEKEEPEAEVAPPASSPKLSPAALAQLVRAASFTKEQFESLADADRRCCLCQTPFLLPLGLVSHLGRSVCVLPDRRGRRRRRSPGAEAADVAGGQPATAAPAPSARSGAKRGLEGSSSGKGGGAAKTARTEGA